MIHPLGNFWFNKRKMPIDFWFDLKCCNHFLFVYNVVKFFDTQSRILIQLYMDELLFDNSNVFHKDNKRFE